MWSYKPLYQLQVCLQQRWCWSCSDKALKVVNSISLDENKLLTFYPCSIRKNNKPNKAGIGPNTSTPCSTRIGLKDNMFAPLIGFGHIHTIPLFILLPHILMKCFHHLCFTITIQTNLFINRQRNQIHWS